MDKFAFTILKTLTSHTSKGFYLFNVAMAQTEQGIWIFIFPDRENSGNLPKTIKNMFYRGNLPPAQGQFECFKDKEYTKIVAGCCHDIWAFVALMEWHYSTALVIVV